MLFTKNPNARDHSRVLFVDGQAGKNDVDQKIA